VVGVWFLSRTLTNKSFVLLTSSNWYIYNLFSIWTSLGWVILSNYLAYISWVGWFFKLLPLLSAGGHVTAVRSRSTTNFEVLDDKRKLCGWALSLMKWKKFKFRSRILNCAYMMCVNLNLRNITKWQLTCGAKTGLNFILMR
jgi:hypothetical protein